MSGERQKTIAAPAAAEGRGLHSGAPARVVMRPAPANAGIRFLVDGRIVPARAENVSETRLGVTLAKDGASVRTVEHLMAALALADIDNAVIDIDGPETPILDGSAAPFLAMIENAGVKMQDAPRRVLRLSKPLRITLGDRFICFAPDEPAGFDVAIEFEETAIGRQELSIDRDALPDWRARLASARTFCSAADIDAMRAAGLARGGSLENAIVVDRERLLNPEGLRDPLEFVLHKTLDLVGDLALIGAPFEGRIRAFKPGHDINNRAARSLLATAPAPGGRAALAEA